MPGSHLRFCSSVPAAEDKFGGDLGTRAERADADIGARQFLRHDAHRFLAEAEAAVVLRDGQAEHAELGHLRDDRRAECSCWSDASRCACGVTSLSANLRISSRIASSVSSSPQSPTVASWWCASARPGGPRRSALPAHQPVERRRQPFGDRRRGEPEVRRTHDLALAHRNAALDLRQIFADPDAGRSAPRSRQGCRPRACAPRRPTSWRIAST